MITSIHIDGFRSLNNFQLKLNPGINLLVGPNGSGKTNIITFLTFLSKLIAEGVRPAFAHIGGAGRAFRRLKGPSFNSTISCSVTGKIKGVRHRSTEKEATYNIDYKYDFEVGLSSEKRILYFKKQNLKATVSKKGPKSKGLFSEDAHEFEIQSITNERLETSLDLKSYSAELVDKMWFSLKKEKDVTIEDAQNQIRSVGISPDSPIFWATHAVFWPGGRLQQDMSEIVMLNIDPRAVRTAEDSAKEPGIKDDGSGLAATLYFYDQLANRLDLPDEDGVFLPALSGNYRHCILIFLFYFVLFILAKKFK